MDSVLLIAPHPDDEILGAGIWMSRNPGAVTIVHATDGSPRDLRDATAAGFDTREVYAEARRSELREALAVIDFPPQQCVTFNFLDQELIFELESFLSALNEVIARVRPTLVLAPAFEGGHPDHDAAALAAAHLKEDSGYELREYRLYHGGPDGRMDAVEFLPPVSTTRITFTPEEVELKRTMLNCFRSQARVLAQFPITDERFRTAPVYDFTQPPHPGPLLYERWNFGITGEQWRAQACALQR